MLSAKCRYGIRAAAYLAREAHDGDYLPIRAISNELGISFHFLTKILQDLSQCGLVASLRGPNGGVALARSASEIFVSDVVEGIDGTDLWTGCILGLPNCGDETPCGLHAQWAKERDRLFRLFSRTTLAQLAKDPTLRP